jgi:hypothetical protein
MRDCEVGRGGQSSNQAIMQWWLSDSESEHVNERCERLSYATPRLSAHGQSWKLRLTQRKCIIAVAAHIPSLSLPATMKLSWGFVASSLYCTIAAAANGHVFTFDGTATRAAPASSPIDPETARLILAQRLGLSRFHSIKDADAAAIKSINAYGGRHQKLFGEDAETSRAKLLMWLDDASEDLAEGRPYISLDLDAHTTCCCSYSNPGLGPALTRFRTARHFDCFVRHLEPPSLRRQRPPHRRLRSAGRVSAQACRPQGEDLLGRRRGRRSSVCAQEDHPPQRVPDHLPRQQE